jgi:uncharacterized protein YaiI (UPF0178 family)
VRVKMSVSKRGKIWVDGDAVPGPCKEIIYRASVRTDFDVVLVANRFQVTPKFHRISFVLVGAGPDVADDYIAENCAEGDLVVTDDLPLAARVLASNAAAIRFRGEELTQSSIHRRLAVRDLLDDLRGSGIHSGGPPPYATTDKQKFANALDRWLTRAQR